MDKLSVIMPSYRHDPHLIRTIDSVLGASKEDIEIIVYLDEYVEAPLREDDRVIYLKSKEHIGMRNAINEAVEKSTGKFIMKLDSHSDICNGFDAILKSQTDENWISVPSRYNLNVNTWEKYNGPIDHLYLKFPNNLKKEIGFRYKLFEKRAEEKKDEMITDIIGFQGSCFLMHKDFFKAIGGLDNDTFSPFGSLAHELAMKVWLTTDGRVVRNRNTWHAHYHPNEKRDKLLRQRMFKSMSASFRLDMLNRWPNQKRPFKWVIDKFGPFPGWPKDWHTDEYIGKLQFEGYV